MQAYYHETLFVILIHYFNWIFLLKLLWTHPLYLDVRWCFRARYGLVHNYLVSETFLLQFYLFTLYKAFET